MWKGIVMADEKTNQEVASKLKVDLNDLYYPGGTRELDNVPRIKLLKSMMSFKCFEAENADDKFKNMDMEKIT